MSIVKSTYLYLSIIVLALIGFQHIAFKSDLFSKKVSSPSNYISFGSQKLTLSPVKKHLSLPVNNVDWSKLTSTSVFSTHNDLKSSHPIKKMDVLVENESRHAVFSTSVIDYDFWKAIYSKFGSHATLYLKITDAFGKQYASVLSKSPNDGLYSEHLLNGSFYDFASLALMNNTGLESSDHKEFPLLTMKAAKGGDAIPITYISNETVQDNLDCTIDFSSRSPDSLHLLIKSGHGNIHKLHFAPSERIRFKSLLAQHVEETTIYFCDGSPTSEDRKLGVIVISDRKKMLAVQPTLLTHLVGMSVNDIVCEHLYFRPANIDFVWGDLELRLTKNKEGNYHAKKRIAKSEWVKTIHGSPNLMMGQTLNMDSLSFDFSIASQHKDTVNEVRVENVQSEDFANTIKINLPDTLAEKNTKSFIRLDDIQNEGIDNGKISLELEIYDDSPRIKEKKYQLHWGFIDTTLTQNEKKKFFTESLAMSIGQFNELLTKEPVLTSSTKGVLDAFDFELVHLRENKKLQTKRVETNIKDDKVFLNSMKKFKLQNKIEVGDSFSLQKFSGEELPKQETLQLKINIDNDRQEEESIDDSNIFLSWGRSILKATPLVDNSQKKKIQDQIIDRKTLLQIVKSPVVLNRFGVKEAIVSAEWFINEDIYTTKKCNTKWKDCFANYINEAKSGDFVSLFLRTKNGDGAICQFYLDRIKGEDIIGYGNTEFDSLLFKYAKQTYRSDTRPKYDYDFVWGNSEFNLELKGNPRVFGGAVKINQEELEDLLDEKIYINSSDGEVISIEHAYLYITPTRTRNKAWRKKWISYDFDCENLDCALSFQDAQKLLKELEEEVYSLRVFVDKHTQSEEHVKVSFIDFYIENESHSWVPKEWVSSNVNTDIFEFQFVYQEKEKTLVKLDKQNEKYKWIVDKYENDPAVEIVNIPSFKTVQRAIYTKNDKGANKGIRTTEVLSKDYTNAYTLNDYHDLKRGETKLIWKGYQSLYGGQSYCKNDFICSDGDLQLQIGSDVVPILRGDLIILPEEGPGYKFIFDDIDSMEIISILKDIPPKTNLFFENIIIPDDKGERVRLPLKFAYHLE